jgi:TDG/mug DNA glycosylase family protein
VKDLATSEFIDGAVKLKDKLLSYQPRLICFQGVMVYERYLRFGEGIRRKVGLGMQEEKIGFSSCFVVPNPSPANAGFSFDSLLKWYLELKAFLERE